MRVLRKLLVFLVVLPAWEKLLVLELAFELARAAVELRLRRFQDLVPDLGEPGVESPTDVEPDPLPPRVGGHLRSLCSLLPSDSTCLVQAVAGSRSLARRGYGTTLYLGVRRGGEGMKAHAWLRWGRRILTGAPGHEDFTVVAVFGSARRRARSSASWLSV